MKRSELEQRIAPAKHLLSYFNQQALASYRNEPDKYILESDSFEGRLTVTDSYYLELEKGDRTSPTSRPNEKIWAPKSFTLTSFCTGCPPIASPTKE